MKSRVKSSLFRVQNTESFFHRLLFPVHCFLFACLFLFTCYSSLVTASPWSGVDETVVEKYAKEHGRVTREPLVNTDQGDLLLFVFLLAGTAGGFTAGYYWRTLMEQRAKKTEPAQHQVQNDKK